jgi:hypothetical protein
VLGGDNRCMATGRRSQAFLVVDVIDGIRLYAIHPTCCFLSYGKDLYGSRKKLTPEKLVPPPDDTDVAPILHLLVFTREQE